MRRLKPLAPRTEDLYKRQLERAFGSYSPDLAGRPIPASVSKWPESVKILLRAAYRRLCAETGVDPEPILAALPEAYQIRRAVRVPGEEEAKAYEAAASKLPRGRRAVVILPLAMGLRAEEVCNLTRESCERAAKTGQLVFQRKGGWEQTLKVDKLKALFRELLAAPASPGKSLAPIMAWNRVGEILSPGKYHAQYQSLRRLVQACSAAAGIDVISPHKLRHAFATRMNRDGAPIFTIQAALGHKHITTTARYVSPTAEDVHAHMREF